MPDPEIIRAELARIAQSHSFSRSARLIEFLRFTVNETLDGRQSGLKEYLIGVEVYRRGRDFDPKADSIVRTEAARLRLKLSEYYAGEGKRSQVIIRFPKGGYAPAFDPVDGASIGPKPLTIAVLPFVNTGGTADNECFGDGLTDELIAALAAIENLRVIARTSVFEFKGKALDIREIGRRLGADALVEGTTRVSGARVRITTRLIDAATGSHRWSQTYEREWRDIMQPHGRGWGIRTAFSPIGGLRRRITSRPLGKLCKKLYGSTQTTRKLSAYTRATSHRLSGYGRNPSAVSGC